MLNLVAVVSTLLAVVSTQIGAEWFVRSALPAWLKFGLLLSTFAAVLMVAWFNYDRPRAIVRRQIARLNHGLCPECGYDLRASTGRCPECGTADIHNLPTQTSCALRDRRPLSTYLSDRPFRRSQDGGFGARSIARRAPPCG
jgi:hypothetical protein